MEEKIISRLFTYLRRKGIPHTRFEKEVGFSNGYLNTQLKRNSDLGESAIRKIVDYCLDIDPIWLLTGRGSMLKEDAPQAPQPAESADIVHIPIVDISVAAGSGFSNPDYIEEVDNITMPASMIKGRKDYLCIRVKGHSMIPSILDGGYLVVRMLDRSEWEGIRDNYVYVVTDTEGKAYVKRLKNRLREHGFIVCMSDNADKLNFPNFNIYEENLHTIWYAEWYFSAKIPNIQEVFYRKQAELEEAVEQLKEQFQEFRNTLKPNNY